MKAQRAAENKLAHYLPYPKQVAFHAAGARCRERLLIAANQSGKSLAGAMECAMHATGRYPDWWKGRRFDKPTIGWGAGTTNETTRDTVQRILVGRPGQPGTAAIPKDAITKPFASSRIAAITSFVPCPKAYEGGTWDIAKNKSALQGVVPAEPSPATFRRILSPESIQATAPPDRVPRQREHFCPKLLADSGRGMIPHGTRRATDTRPVLDRSSRRFSIANKADTCHTANSRCVLAATCAAEGPAYSCQALERWRIGLAPRGNPRGNGAARQITGDRSDHEAVGTNGQIFLRAAG